MSRAVVIFARAPESEARAKGLPARTAAPLFRALVAAWIRAARRAAATPIVASSAPDRTALLSIENVFWIEQRGDRFGERLASSASDAFALGFQSVLIAGIDTPPRELGEAFEILERGDARAVIAPALDGGVNLIGLGCPDVESLRSIEVGQHDVAERLRSHFPDLIALAARHDIDSVSDAVDASLENDWLPFRALLLGCGSEPGFAASPAHAPFRASDVDESRAPPRAG